MYPSLNPNITTVSSWKDPKFTTKTLEKIKSQTPIGALIKFAAPVINQKTGHYHMNEVRGYVEEKYPHIFKLSDGRYYMWVDYMIGYIC